MGRKRSMAVLAAAALWLSATATPTCADSWELPETTIYRSADGRARMIVSPRDLESQLAYFDDLQDDEPQPGQRADGEGAARARVERWQGGRWHRVWDRSIPNGVAPVQAIVRDDARYAATFDDWHGTGYGPNVIVVYGADGRIVRRLALADMLPAYYIDALSHSVSSIHWRGTPRFSGDGRHVVVPIVIPNRGNASSSDMVDLTVALADGAVAFADAGQWRAARDRGCQVRQATLAAEARHKAEFLAPLRRPATNDQGAWHDYLREAIARRFGDGRSQASKVLRSPDAADYAISEQWLREQLTDPHGSDTAIATLSEPNLVPVLRRIVPGVARGSQKGKTLYVAISARYWPQVEAALRPLGATLVHLDPDVPIAQRPERIARRYGA